MPDLTEPGDIEIEPEMKESDVLQLLALCDRLEI